MPLSPGTIVGHYEIRSRLSAGQREIYLARDTRLGREVAITLLPKEFTETTTFTQRFERELFSVSALNYPGILTVHDMGEDRGRYFIVTETFDGSLRDRLSAAPMRLSEALGIAFQIAGALEAAHAREIIHRDIKPENILLRRSMVKVADFGLAKLREYQTQEEIEEDATTTMRGVVLGSIAYMSPEQLIGESVDSRTDIWSVGVVLYEMITGHRPFEGSTPMETILSILHHMPPPPASYVPIEIQRILNKALTKDRHLRYQSASELLADLREALIQEGTSVTASSPALALPFGSWTEPTFERIRQRPTVRNGLIALISIAVAAVAILVFWSPKPNRDRALREELEEATNESESYARNRYNSVEQIKVTLGEGKTVTGYDAENVIAAIRSSQADLVEGIRAPELTPLRDYIAQFFPVPQIETLERLKLEKPNEHSLTRVLVTEDAKNAAFENIFEFISRIRALVDQRRLSIDLTVTSAPQDGASFGMWASGGPHRTTSTNNLVDNVYRGFYRYKVTKGGFKEIEDSLNLVDSDGRQLDCFLNQLNDQDGPRPCKLR